jgi:uncharacterized peroxidase-related enzyme
MRLRILDRGHRPIQRLALLALRLVGRTDPDPVAKLSLYRPGLFGRQWLTLIGPVMRGSSAWSDGERELLAAFVSRLNTCRFCVGVHEKTAGLLLGEDVVQARLDGWRDGPLDPRLAATFGLLEKVTLRPDEVGPADIRRVRATGVSVEAVSDALYVAYVFNVVNRLANALDFDWKTDADRLKLATQLNRIRYHVPRFLLR